MSRSDRLSWTIARHMAKMPAGSAFTATSSATLGVMLAQEVYGSELALSGRGGAYDVRGILSIHARHWLFNQRPRAYVDLPAIFDSQSEPHALLATPAQIDGNGAANLSGLGPWSNPKVAFGGTRGMPDARAIHFVLPSHSNRQLIGKVDFVSTNVRSRKEPSLLFTELCVLRWSHDAAQWELIEIAPEVSLSDLQAQTGFEFLTSAELRKIEDVPANVLDLIEKFDPLNVRELDFISGRQAQLDAYEKLYHAEKAMVQRQQTGGAPAWTL